MPDAYDNLKASALKKYKDSWILFKIQCLRHIDYFNEIMDYERLLEIQFFMQEKVYQKGNYIVDIGQVCTELIFIANGKVEIIVEDECGD